MAKRESTGGGSGLAQLLRDASAAVEKRLKKSKPRVDGKAALEAAEALLKDAGFRESRAMRVMEAAEPAGKLRRLKICLVDEGLGNHRNMNYYGKPAIASAAKVYEGKPSFTNHPAVDEEENLPERDVMKQYGFYEGLHVEQLKNKHGKMVDACVGFLNFEDSALGRQMYCKGLAALEYQKRFPESGDQYIGWSILGGGRGEDRELDPAEDATGTMEGFTEPVEVNYVMEFLEAESCDAVTRAGRGGRVLAVAEDASGHNKEDGMITKLKATLKKLTESAAKAEGDEKKVLEAAAKDLKATIKTMEDDAAAEEGKDPFEAMCAQKEGESDDDHKKRLALMGKALAKHLGAGADKEAEPDPDEPDDKPADADTQEARRDALKAYAKEAGVPEGAYSDAKIARLAKLPYKEAKALIDDDAQLAEASRKDIAAELDLPVASLRSRERGGSTEEKTGGRNAAAFKESFQERN